MDKELLLVSNQKSFMVNAMVKNITGEGYHVAMIRPDIEDYNALKEPPKTVLVNLDGNITDYSGFLVYLESLIMEKRKEIILILIGSEEDISVAKLRFRYQKAISETFVRPLNVKELVEFLDDLREETRISNAKKHILVVDDDATMLRTLKLWLSGKYVVYMANSGLNAFGALEKNRVDLILLDYEMPMLSGPEVLRKLRESESTAHIPVMFLTAKNDKASMESVKELKPERYLLKTMPPDQLMNNIEGFFAGQ